MELPRISKNSVKENSERAETQLKSRKTVPVLFCPWFMQTDVYQWLCSHTKHQSMKHKLWPFTVQLLSRVWLFATPWTVACQASLSFTISQRLLKLVSIESVMPSNHLVLCVFFISCLQSFPTSASVILEPPKIKSVTVSIFSPSIFHEVVVPDAMIFVFWMLNCVVIFLSYSVQFSSVVQSCPTLCDPMDHSTPGLPVHHQLPEFTQIHVLSY